MSLWVLDTDSLTLWLRGHPSIATRVAQTLPSQLATTIITVEEILRGWYTQGRRARNDDQLARAYRALQETVEFTRRIQLFVYVFCMRNVSRRKVEAAGIEPASESLQLQCLHAFPGKEISHPSSLPSRARTMLAWFEFRTTPPPGGGAVRLAHIVTP